MRAWICSNFTSEDSSSESQELDDSRYGKDNDRDDRVSIAIRELFNLSTDHVITCDDPEYDVYEIKGLENSIKSNPKFVVLDEFDPEYNRYLTTFQGFCIYSDNKETYDWAFLQIGETAAARNHPCLDNEALCKVISYIEAGERVLVVPKYGPYYAAEVKEKHREFYSNSKPNELLLSFQYYLKPPKDHQEILSREDHFLIPLENELTPS